MKSVKIAAAIMALGIAGTIPTYGIGQVQWGPGETTPIQNPSGIDIPATTGWIVGLYETTDANIDILALLTGGSVDDVLRFTATFNTTTSPADGYFYNEINNPSTISSGDRIYSVVFNSTTIGGATMFLVLENSNTPTTVPGGDPPVYAYDPTGGTQAQWVAVPEPSTYAFMGIGAILLAVRRFRRA